LISYILTAKTVVVEFREKLTSALILRKCGVGTVLLRYQRVKLALVTRGKPQLSQLETVKDFCEYQTADGFLLLLGKKFTPNFSGINVFLSGLTVKYPIGLEPART
jgi:hypothetical protein